LGRVVGWDFKAKWSAQESGLHFVVVVVVADEGFWLAILKISLVLCRPFGFVLLCFVFFEFSCFFILGLFVAFCARRQI